MGNTLLFCLVFASQILLISWFYPQRAIRRSRYVLANYPASSYPKLYSLPAEHYERRLSMIARVNLAVVVAGFVIVGLIVGELVGEVLGAHVAGLALLRPHNRALFIVVPFFMLQLATGIAYIDLSAHKFLKARAKLPQPRLRTTELQRRNIVDFVPPGAIAGALFVNVAFVAFVLYAYANLELPLFKVVGSIGAVVLALAVFSVSVSVALRARKPNPYQAQQDRRNVLKLVVQQALTVSIALPVLLAALMTFKLFAPGQLEPVMVSLYVQGLALAMLWPSWRYRVDKVDFDVYRQDAQQPTSGVA